jgi:hypothetical protein
LKENPPKRYVKLSENTLANSRNEAAFSRKVSVTGDFGDCVVADAVQVEPVSTAKFPANRENNREFAEKGV